MSNPFLNTRVSLKPPWGATEACDVSGEHRPGAEVILRLTSPSLGSHSYVAGDLFQALLDLRRKIEPAGWRLLVNGARRNAWPSGMAAQMSAGAKLYLLPEGRKPDLHDVVATFDPAPEADVVDVEEQVAFKNAYFGVPRRH